MTGGRQVNDGKSPVREKETVMSIAPDPVIIGATVRQAISHAPHGGNSIVARSAGLKIPKANDAAHQRLLLLRDGSVNLSTQLVSFDY